MSSDLIAQAQAWVADDPDPVTRSELTDLIAAVVAGEDQAAELADRFSGDLKFGTAGLRGALGAGPNRMNRVVVARAAAGIARYLHTADAAVDRCVVVGYDARHNSQIFAHETAEILQGAGLAAKLLPSALPTPVLAFAVKHLRAVAGIMVTASHNPPQDNGYKVYLGDGRQIVAPADAEISAAIADVGSIRILPRATDYQILDDDILNAYLDSVAALPAPGPRELKVAYTPMHGVGAGCFVEAMLRAGFGMPAIVTEQAMPDPDFPTVAFPNPEEPGAMDLLLELGEETNADLAIAHDPDADRCAAALRSPSGTWRTLTGDEIGALLGSHLIHKGHRGAMANSIVSSRLLRKIALAAGLAHAETLTGFKWISRVPELSFGYEEALGYCVDPPHVSDKDGISAAVILAEAAAMAKKQGRTLGDLVDDLYRAHGVHLTSQYAVRVTHLNTIVAAMTLLRTTPPEVLGGSKVVEVIDLSKGSAALPPTNGIVLHLANGARVIARPSGTEPKLKCYLEVVQPVLANNLDQAQRAAHKVMATIREDIAAFLGSLS
jgi:phosphomannomutase